MRTIFRSEEFDEYYALQPARVREKIDYALSVLEQIKVVNTKLVKISIAEKILQKYTEQ